MRPINKGLMAFKERTAGREEILQAILDFVKSVVLKRGIVTKADERGGNIYVTFELNDFNRLYFAWSVSNAYIEGDNVQISYSPSRNKRYLVFSANYRKDAEKCQIHFFSEEPDWQKAFAYAVKHVSEILTKWHAKQPKDWHEAERARRRKKEAVQLMEKAESLRIESG
ncbi:MAG: hypothetical protein NTW46_04025 [Candidatus Nealsonbacteria bacterium]|nr:hypothetical protein [Candidatus Nealsonbacteria bacterium]